MAYKIIDIQGIGEAYAPKLIAIGIKTPEELLEACLTPSARKKVAEETGISGKLILKWANHADLFPTLAADSGFFQLEARIHRAFQNFKI